MTSSPACHRVARPAAAALLTAGLLAGCATPPAPLGNSHPLHAPCPAGLPDATQCLSGRDEAGAYWWIAVPRTWTGVLVLHAHGGPELGPPKAERSAEDLKRWAVMVRAGHAWAGSTFRQGGVAVRAAAEDTERLRQIFVRQVGQPKRTVLHGQSWGASVAAQGAEMYPRSQDAVLLTSGVLGGGTRSYDFRLDLRVVYQAVCGNHPAPGEPAYPVWMGLPEGSPLTRAELARRVNDCTGVNLPAAQRSAAQARALDSLVRQARIPERTLIGHMNWATWHFQDIVTRRTGGRNPFGNIGATYTQADGGDELNRSAVRHAADPVGVAALAADTDPGGRIDVPVLSLRGVKDAIAFVELDSVFRQTMDRAGRGDRLVQAYSNREEHSYLSDAEYLGAMEALLAWVDQGRKPVPQDLVQHCEAWKARTGSSCQLLPDYRAADIDTRVTPRQRPTAR